MTLHEAILEVLIKFKNSATTQEIANYINTSNLYKRGDGNPISSSQISARVSSYPQLFQIDSNNKVAGIPNNGNDIVERLPKAIFNILRNSYAHSSNGSFELNLLVCTLLIYHRKNAISYLVEDFVQSLGLDDDETKFILKAIKNFPKNDYDRIFELISSSNLNLISADKFQNLFRNWLNTLGQGAPYTSGQYFTPSKINNLICRLLKKDKMYLTVFDPFGGAGTTICFLQRVINQNTCFEVQDINTVITLLGKLNLIANEINNFHYSKGDSVLSSFDSEYDLICTTLPFGLKVDIANINYNPSDYFGIRLSGRLPIEFFIICKAIKSLKSDGQAIIVLPENFLFSSQRSALEIRKELVHRGLISKIISIPIGGFHPYSGVKTSIIVIDRENASKRSGIEFIELTKSSFYSIPEFFAPEMVVFNNLIFVDNVEITKNNYDLTVGKYNSELKFENSPQTDRELVSLNKIISSFNPNGNINRLFFNETDGIPFVSVKHLSKPGDTPFLHLGDTTYVEDSVETRELYKRYFIPQNAILISRVGTNLNPSLFTGDQPVLTNPNILCMVVKDDLVDSLFLSTELNEDYVKQQLDLIRRGAALQTINKHDLLTIKIWLPDIEEQKKIANKRLAATIRETEIKVTANTRVFTNEIISVFKHEFGNLKNPLIAGIQNLEDFLTGRIDINNEKISSRANSRNIKQVIEGLKHLSNEMGVIIEDMVDAIDTEKKLEKTNILTFFSQIDSKMFAGKCQIQVSKNISKKDFFNIDPNSIYKAFRNLVNNSEKHGYDNLNQEKNILFKVEKAENNQYINIDFINDGRPFKEGFTFDDYISFGKKSGPNSGSGIGGYLINKIIRDHDGFFEEIKLEGANLFEN